MSDTTFEDTSIFRRFKATHGVPDAFADSNEATIAFDEVLTPLGLRAPMRGPNESEADHLAKLGTFAAHFGPQDRKAVNRFTLPSAALAEFVRQDLDIASQEIEHPKYSLKPGELREVVKTDACGREIKEFYSDEQTGVSPWFDMFKPQVIRYVSGGSAGISTPDSPPSSTYHFHKHEILPELIEVQRQLAYQDSAEFKVKEAYALAGKEVPEEVLAKLRSAP
jgi:hypothetical protein